MKKRFLKALAVAMLPVVLTGTLASCGNSNSNNTVDVSKSQKENDGHDEKNDIEKVVLSIEKTSSDGLDDIYTITFTDGTTTTFKITNEKPENPNDPVLSAYETYKKNHPEYQGTEEDWINDLIEGNLSSKIMISFDTNNGSNINPIIISAGSSLNSIETPTREGFKFEGWKINDEIIDINSYKFNESITLQAVWTDIRVNVDSLYLLETNDAYTVLGVDDNHPSNITIPSTYDNKNIISISSYAFKNINDIKSIKFGKNIQKIDSNAFKGCNVLENVFFEGSNDEWNNITNNALEELANVDICFYSKKNPNSVGNYWYYDEDGETPIIWNELRYGLVNNEYVALGLGECKNKDIVIPRMYKGKKVTGIGAMAFYNCTNLETIELPDTIKSIETAAFLQCTNLKSIKIPEGLTSIKADAFDECRSLTNIELPNSVTYIGDYAFYNCQNLRNVELSNNLISIGKEAFYSCYNLRNIEIPDSVTSIGEHAFGSCRNLRNIKLPFIGDKLENPTSTMFSYVFYDDHIKNIIITKAITIGENAFILSHSSLESLENIVLPNTIKSIGKRSFNDDLKNICYNGSKNEFDSIQIDSGSGLDYNKISYYSKEEPLDMSESYWHYDEDGITPILWQNGLKYETTFDDEIRITGIGDYKNTDIIIPKTYKSKKVTYIGPNAFLNCTSLTSIQLPNSIIRIERGAFSGCTNLTSIKIPDSLTYIGESVFRNCNSLQYNEYDNAKYLGNENNPYLILVKAKSIDIVTCVIDEKCKFIDTSAFAVCFRLTSVTIGNSVTSIGKRAFDFCTSLTRVYYKGTKEQWNTISIGDSNDYLISATRYYYSETEPTDGDNLYWHYDDDGITPILWLCQLENGLEYINVDGGYKIIGIGSCKDNDIIVPETYNGKNIISIGTNAFSNSTNLTSIKLPDSIIEIEKGAFNGCHNLINITIPFIGETLEKSTNETMDYFFGGKYWGLKKITITKALSIGADAFHGYILLTSIEIPNSVTSIGEYAFSYCKGLTSIEIPNSVTSIGEYAFSNCSGLTSIEIPNSVTSIGEGAFSNCSGLTSIEIPNSVTSIGSSTFYGCSDLTNIVIPESVANIGNYAFNYCSGLTDVYYKGTMEQWNTISIVDSNDYLTSATRYYYSETQPTDTDYKYWHYVDGVPTAW